MQPVSNEAATGPQTISEIKPVVLCLRCSTEVCTTFHSFVYLGGCNQGGLNNPELEKAFDEYCIKRCPRCRTAVQKSEGCNHIRCNCSANFCFG